MATPLSSRSIQMHRQPSKRQCIDLATTPSTPGDLDDHVQSILRDDSIPAHLRTVIAFLLEDRKQLQTMMEQCREMTDTIASLRDELSVLKNSFISCSPPSQTPVTQAMDTNNSTSSSPPPTSTQSFEEIERRRSVVIAGLGESQAEHSSTRVLHDFNAVREIMDFLSIDCSTLSVYRLGRFNANHPRLVKVVLPASFFAKLMVRRAPRLRRFKVAGLFIRPSLSKPERDRLRAERAARRSHHQPSPLQAQSSNSSAACNPNSCNFNVAAHVNAYPSDSSNK